MTHPLGPARAPVSNGIRLEIWVLLSALFLLATRLIELPAAQVPPILALPLPALLVWRAWDYAHTHELFTRAAAVKARLSNAADRTRRVIARQKRLPLDEAWHRHLDAGGGAVLAHNGGRWIAAPRQAATVVLAAPRTGKTSGVLIPAVMAHTGAAVVASTKREVFDATNEVRWNVGDVYVFDPAGLGIDAPAQPLYWSPLTRAREWRGALVVAEAMANVVKDPRNAHWAEKAADLLAAMFHAAAAAEFTMRDASRWIFEHDLDTPLAELDPRSSAASVLIGIRSIADRERSSIFSTASRAIRAYRSDAALASADEGTTIDLNSLARSNQTIYIFAPAHEQELVAPLIVGLLTDIRHTMYAEVADVQAHSAGAEFANPLLWALDECANIAPIPDLPTLLSEGGGQGIQTMCVFQDWSQVERRWGRSEADGMLSLFGAKVVLAGLAHPKVLDTLSLIAGETDRPIESASASRRLNGKSRAERSVNRHWTTRRERVLPADSIARLERGEALVMVGPDWEIASVKPWTESRFWRAVHEDARERVDNLVDTALSMTDSEIADLESSRFDAFTPAQELQWVNAVYRAHRDWTSVQKTRLEPPVEDDEAEQTCYAPGDQALDLRAHLKAGLGAPTNTEPALDGFEKAA